MRSSPNTWQDYYAFCPRQTSPFHSSCCCPRCGRSSGGRSSENGTSIACDSSRNPSLARCSLSLLKAKKKGDIVLESNHLSLVHLANNSYQSDWEAYALIVEARRVMGLFKSISLARCTRELNSVADWIYKAHGLKNQPSNWVAQPPNLFEIYYVLMPMIWVLVFGVLSYSIKFCLTK